MKTALERIAWAKTLSAEELDEQIARLTAEEHELEARIAEIRRLRGACGLVQAFCPPPKETSKE